ncbi:MAG: Crp/Fnr family transcriptional regulator [Burkholderiales bacterium]
MDDDLDFSGKHPTIAPPARSPVYNAAVAMAFFRAAGKSEEVVQGASLFAENDKTSGLFSKGDRMYLLIEGEVGLAAGEKVLGTVKVGEIFGEMAALTQQPRSASAVAKTRCRLLSLDGKQFEAGIQRMPEFALMLMSILIQRLRQTTARLRGSLALAAGGLAKPTSVFDKKLMAGLQRLTQHRDPARFAAKSVIMKEGDAATFVYVVLEGSVAIAVRSKVVERVAPGGIFGEMALVDQSARSASATAETDCSLLALNRSDFLSLVKTSPAFGLALLKALADRLGATTSHYK